MSKIEKALEWMIELAYDDSHGYDQDKRWGERGDYDCSSAVITAWQKAGVPVKTEGATYTGNMYDVFKQCGFKDVTFKVNLRNGDGLEPGDVLLNHVHHTAMYIGDGLEVEASINERGTAHGGQPGDQTGREILIRPYRNYPWDCVLRYTEQIEEEPQEEEDSLSYEEDWNIFHVEEVSVGSECPSVKLLQTLLKGIGFYGYSDSILEVDGIFGKHTEYAVRQYQLTQCIEVDGIAGPQTWGRLLKGLHD